MKKGYGSVVDEKGRYFAYYQKEEWTDLLAQANFELISIEETTEIRVAEKVEWLVTVSKN
jgi:hypothetical protein